MSNGMTGIQLFPEADLSNHWDVDKVNEMMDLANEPMDLSPASIATYTAVVFGIGALGAFLEKINFHF